MGMIPIDRAGGDASAQALDAAARILDRGELFGIYPEGTRARDGVLHKGHTGIARLALRTNSPIVPVGIIGTDTVQPPDARLPAPFRRVHIRFGRPIPVERYLDRGNDRMVLRQITDEVMFEIRNLSGQDYVDTYATKPARAVPVETPVEPGLAPVVPLPTRPAAATEPALAATGHGNGRPQRRGSERVVVASAAAGPVEVAVEADGVERRSSASVMRSRPLDLDLALTGA
jgi:1-acyl-sn-glycerol-3-phosphate acyltransferase